jgi:hypothetical protein
MTNAERKTKLLDMLAKPEELQSGEDRIRYPTRKAIIDAIHEIDRQEVLESGTGSTMTTYAKVNRAK